MLKTGDLVRVVRLPWRHRDLHGTLAIVVENFGQNMFGTDRVMLHCLHDGRQIRTTVDNLDLIAK
jgi:hypothetical protein